MSAIGTVSQLIGRAIAVKADGSERVLSIGDEVQADELIRVSPDGSLEIKMESGDPVNLEGGQSWLATADTFQESDDFDTTEAIADVQSIQEAILAGADPTEVAEETAAGGEGEADGNEGSSFVQVEATREEVDPTAGYETVGIFDAPSELPSELQILLAPASKVTLEGSVVNEGDGTATITATVDNAPLTDLTITLSTGDTITILTGQTSGSTEVKINNEDDIYLDGEEFPVSILTTDGGNYESLDTSDTASVVILDTIDTINISLSATPSLSEGDATGIEYTVTLSGGVANNDITVTLDNGEVIVIPAGDPSASTFTAVQGDDVYLDGETVTNSIVSAAETNAGTPGALEDLTYDGSAVETVISDTEDTVTVSLSATPSLSEGDATGIEYTVTLSGGVANNDITVTLDNGEVIVIPAGDPSASTFTAVQGDDVYLDGETVTNSIVSAAETNAGTPGALEDLTYDGSAVETVISDTEDTVTVSLSATPSLSEGDATGIEYTVTLSGGVANNDITVTLDNGEVIVIPAGDPSASTFTAVQGDDVYLDGETVTNSIVSAAEANAGTSGALEDLTYDGSAVETVISDTEDTVTVSLSATPSLSEGDATGIEYTVTLSGGVANNDITVTLDNGEVIVIPAGDPSASTFTAVQGDDVYLDGETVTNSIVSAAETNAGTPGALEDLTYDGSAVETVISDTEDTVTVSLSATPSLSEGDATGIEYTVTLSGGVANNDITVTLDNGEVIVIPAGDPSASTFTAVQGDDVYLDGETVTNSIVSAAETNAGTPGALEDLTYDGSAVETVISDTEDTVTVSLSATPSLSEGDATGIEYTVTLSGGVANNDITVTLDNGEVIVIPAGDPSASTFTAVQGDDVYLDGETVTNSIVSAAEANAGTPGALEDLTYDGSTVETVISDTEDTVTVSLSATPSLSEGDATGIEYTVTLSGGVANNDITVTLDNGEVIVIPAGDPSASTFTAVQGDDVYLDGETVTNSIVSAAETNAGTPGALEDLTYDGSAVETVISDTEDTVTVSLSATPSLSEGDATGIEYTVTLSGGVANNDITVTLDNGEVIVIPAGDPSASTFTAVQGDDVYLDGETVTNSIVSAAEANAGTPGALEDLTYDGSAVETVISDTEDTVTVSLSATPSLSEGDATGIEYTVTLSGGVANNDITVTLDNGEVIVIPAGDPSASTFTAVQGDDVYLDGETVTNSIVSAAETNAGTPGALEDLTYDGSAVETVISDTEDTVTVSLSATPSLSEGDATGIEYTVTLSGGVANNDITVTLDNGEVIVIPAGDPSASTFTAVQGDDVYLDGETVTNSIVSAAETNAGTPGALEDLTYDGSTVETVISDTEDTVTVSLSATPSLSEGDATGIEYTVTLSGGVANNDITVTLDNGEVIVIPAGDPSASTFTAVQGDDVYLDGETVTNSIVSAAETNAGTPGALEDLTYDGSAVETVISDTEDTVTVSLSATPSLSEGDATGIEYTVTLSGGVANNDITVTLDNGEVIVIPAGDPSASTFTAVQGDDVYLDGETVTNSIVSAAETNAGTPGALEDLTYDGSTVETVISDTEDTVTATLTTSTSEIAETGGSITYTVTLSGTPGSIDPDADLVFTLTNPDGSGDPIQVTVSAGAVSGQVVVTYSDSEITTQTSIDNSIASFTGGSEYEELVTAGSTSVVVDYAPVITDLTPEAQGGDVVVDEDDLPNGSDGSDSVTQAGTFTIAAADGVETLAVGSLNVIQNGAYQGDGINIITPEGHTFTISGYDASTGIVSYTYTLNENESHDSAQGENSFFESLSVYLEDSDGDSTTGTLSAQIVDDVPSATPATNSGQITQAVDTNLMLVLDVSGSMNNQSSFQGMTRLEVMVKAGLELLDRYDAYGDVKVNVISFSSEGNDLSGGWVTVSEAKAILLELNAGGTTNYVDALNDLIASYNSNSSGMIADAQKISYFMSDGNPNVGGTVDQAAWESYVTDNGFLSYALGMGSGVNELNLEPIAYDGRGDGRTGSGSDIDVTVVTDLSELEAVLVSTVEVPPLSGLLLNGGVPGVVGADGGWVQSVTVDGVIYSYDAATDSSTVSGGTSNGAFNDDLNEWLITTVEGASLKVYMDTGMYEYLPPDDLVTEMQEVFGYTITDSDGDTASSTLTLSVDPLEGPMVVRDDFVITNQDTIEIPDWTLLANDSGPDSDAQTLTAVDNSVSGAVTDNANNTVTFVDTGTQGGHFSYTNTAGGSSSDGQVSVNQVSGNILEGGYLDEIIIGGTDSEKLIGGAGDDSLFGGDGASSSVYRSIIADVKAGDTYSSDNNQFGFTFAQGTGLFITKISIDITGSGFFDQIGSGSKAFQIGDESDIDLFDITTVTSGDSTVLEIEFAPNAFVEGNTIRFGIDTDTGFNTGDEFGTNDIPFEVTFSDSISVNGIYEPGAGNSSVGTANNLYDDTLEGGQGNDILTGGEGDDIFVWSGSDADGGTDHVTDFAFDLADSNAENDVLDLSDLLSDGSNQLIAAEVDGHMQLTVANASDISDVKQVISLDNINVANDSAADLLKDQLLTNGNIDDGIS